MTTENIMNLRATPSMCVMVDAAKKWLKEHPDADPTFSRRGSMIFNDNSAADEIEIVITEAGEKAGVFVEPQDIWNATVFAQIWLRLKGGE